MTAPTPAEVARRATIDRQNALMEQARARLRQGRTRATLADLELAIPVAALLRRVALGECDHTIRSAAAELAREVIRASDPPAGEPS